MWVFVASFRAIFIATIVTLLLGASHMHRKSKVRLTGGTGDEYLPKFKLYCKSNGDA